MNIVLSVAAVALLTGSSWVLAAPVGQTIWRDLRGFERAALRLTAGLGFTAVLLSAAALAGWFTHTIAVLAMLMLIGWPLLSPDVYRPPAAASGRDAQSQWVQPMAVAFLICAVLACAGAIAPVTDDDALAYGVPIARHIAESGTLRVWPDQARSMWPQSQQVLLAFMLQAGGDRLGLLTALEWLLCIGTVSALAHRVCERPAHATAAVVIALGAPVLAFQVASAKEDLLLLAATAGAALSLTGTTRTELAMAGMFAGIAAGAKYPGALIVAGTCAWPLVARGKGGVKDAAIVALCATTTGGLWYGLNLWRYANPVAPFFAGAEGTPFNASVARDFLDAYGGGKGPVMFILAPLAVFAESSAFGGRAALYNPAAYAGLLAWFMPAVRRRHGALLFAAAVIYAGWFLTLQNARLLLPATVLLAPAAADVIVPIIGRRRTLQWLAAAAAGISIGVVGTVGALRVSRYFTDGPSFLAQETQNYADIQWMNTHLDRHRARIGSDHKVLGYLEVPWLVLDPTRQLEISAAELGGDSERFLEACRRSGITHLFGDASSFSNLKSHLRAIYHNPSSRLGGVRFFRQPPTESTAVFEIVYTDAPQPWLH